MLAIVAPGQGAQSPGFLSPWLEDPAAADRLAWYGAVTGLDLAAHGTVSDAETIRDTAVAQPLLVAAGLLALRALGPVLDEVAGAVLAGHSVGELTAAAAAGVLGEEQALVLVRERGRAMAAASATRPTSMTVVLRGDPDEVLAALQREGLTAANHNGSGQLVAAGTVEQLDALAANPPKGARLVPLSVAGAFHTEHMAPATEHLSSLVRALRPADPRTRWLSNADGALVDSGPEVLHRLVAQVAAPVRWDRCLQTMADLGVTGLLELTPAGTLTGIAKRNLPGVELLALNTPDQVEQARDFVTRHAAGPQAGAER